MKLQDQKNSIWQSPSLSSRIAGDIRQIDPPMGQLPIASMGPPVRIHICTLLHGHGVRLLRNPVLIHVNRNAGPVASLKRSVVL